MPQLFAMFMFMLIPIWIPIIAVTLGGIHDKLRPNRDPGWARPERVHEPVTAG